MIERVKPRDLKVRPVLETLPSPQYQSHHFAGLFKPIGWQESLLLFSLGQLNEKVLLGCVKDSKPARRGVNKGQRWRLRKTRPLGIELLKALALESVLLRAVSISKEYFQSSIHVPVAFELLFPFQGATLATNGSFEAGFRVA
ncbi:hypothetical protein M569_00094 [Genlisea aurea]|uniref:Uncharacterized protein n=1 Tax=Genlisea aurea TaxID=192259 RepID=S8EF63_9LAMI|nr:hypothetical protein M569_00094 [Genlisea aurea]